MITSKKHKIRVEKIPVTASDKVRTFEIRLPDNVSKITSIIVTTNAHMGQFGRVSFQANDNTDIFLVADVLGSGFLPSDETLVGSATEDLDMEPEWVSGRLPKKTLVTVDGDTTVIYGIYRAMESRTFELTVYLEYEETEELVKEESMP